MSGIGDPKLQVIQRYDVSREVYRPNGKLRSANVIARNLPVGPNNTGSKNFPNYDAVGNQAIRSLPGGGKVFVGQRDDPFFVDLGATFDSVHLRKGTGNVGGGKDDLAGYNVHSIVLQVPKSKVTRDGKSVSGPTANNAVVASRSNAVKAASCSRRRASPGVRAGSYGKRPRSSSARMAARTRADAASCQPTRRSRDTRSS